MRRWTLWEVAAGAVLAGMVFSAQSVRVQATLLLVPMANQWRYNQAGVDLGTAWRTNSYDDTVAPWQIGRALFYVENAPYPDPFVTPLQLTYPGNTNQTITYYFRTHFDFPTNTAGVVLLATNCLDDGVVYFLNGMEAGRIRLTGPVEYGTLAANQPFEGRYEMTNLLATPLRQGENVLAAEVHQASATSLDVVFGMSLVALVPETIVITNQPQDLTVERGQTASFTVGVSGSNPYYRWYKDNVLIPGPNAPAYTINNVQTNHAAAYHVVITNVLGSITSRVATLTVVPDTHPPRLLRALASETSSNQAIIDFSESLRASSTTNPANYLVRGFNNSNIIIRVTNATPNAARVRITTAGPLSPDTNWVVTVNGVTDLAGNAIPANTWIGIGWWYDVIPFEQPWNWSDAGVVLEDGWQAPDYNEYTNRLWHIANTNQFPPVGRAPFYACFSPVGPKLGTEAECGPPIFYFRTRFLIPPGKQSAGRVRFTHLVENGAVFYLGGQEVYRCNMPDGPIINETSPTLPWPDPGGPVASPELAVINLVTGTNVLAVEVHAASLNPTPGGFMYFATAMELALAPVVEAEPAPRIEWRRAGPGRIELSWDAPGYVLEAAPTILGPWDPVPQAANRSTNELSGPQRFFRLRR